MKITVGELKGIILEASVPWLDDSAESAVDTDDVIHRIDDLIYAIRSVWIGNESDDVPEDVENAEESIRDAIVKAVIKAERLMATNA
jgi:hypothetical protein